MATKCNRKHFFYLAKKKKKVVSRFFGSKDLVIKIKNMMLVIFLLLFLFVCDISRLGLVVLIMSGIVRPNATLMNSIN